MSCFHLLSALTFFEDESEIYLLIYLFWPHCVTCRIFSPPPRDPACTPSIRSSVFVFGCSGSLLLGMGFLHLQRVRAALCGGAQASHWGGFSCCGARALGVQAAVGLSSCDSRALGRRLRSRGGRLGAPQLWNLPGPGSEPMPLHWQVGS